MVIESCHAESLEFFSADASLFTFIFNVFVGFNTVHHSFHGSEVIRGVSEAGEKVSTEVHFSFVCALSEHDNVSVLGELKSFNSSLVDDFLLNVLDLRRSGVLGQGNGVHVVVQVHFSLNY